MTNEWNDFAEMWDSVASEYADKAFAELQKVVSLKGLRVLDFGCGTGLLSERMAPQVKEIIALDNASKMIEKLEAKKLINVTTVSEILDQELIDNSPLFQEPFDLVVASSVCGFLPAYPATAKLLSSLLSENGIFVQWDWLQQSEESEDGLSKEEVEAALRNANFSATTISVPFEMSSPEGTMPVLMAVGKKS